MEKLDLRALRLALASALVACAPGAAAQIYECTNGAGVKEFAQFCRPGTVQQRQVTKGSEAGAEGGRTNVQNTGSTPKSIELQAAEFKQRTAERQEAETIAAETKSRADEAELYCQE